MSEAQGFFGKYKDVGKKHYLEHEDNPASLNDKGYRHAREKLYTCSKTIQ